MLLRESLPRELRLEVEERDGKGRYHHEDEGVDQDQYGEQGRGRQEISDDGEGFGHESLQVHGGIALCSRDQVLA